MYLLGVGGLSQFIFVGSLFTSDTKISAPIRGFWIYLGSGSGMLVKSALVKTVEKKLFKTSAFSESVSVVSPLSVINGLSPSLDFV